MALVYVRREPQGTYIDPSIPPREETGNLKVIDKTNGRAQAFFLERRNNEPMFIVKIDGNHVSVDGQSLAYAGSLEISFTLLLDENFIKITETDPQETSTYYCDLTGCIGGGRYQAYKQLRNS